MKTWRKPQVIYIKPEEMADMLEGAACSTNFCTGGYCPTTFCSSNYN